MDPNVPWYKNISTLSHIFAALVAVTASSVSILNNDFHYQLPRVLPQVGGFVVSIASMLGIYNNHSGS